MMEMFCICVVQHSGHRLLFIRISVVANERLRCVTSTEKLDFYFILINLHLNSQKDTLLAVTGPDQSRWNPFNGQEKGEKEQSPLWERKEKNKKHGAPWGMLWMPC